MLWFLKATEDSSITKSFLTGLLEHPEECFIFHRPLTIIPASWCWFQEILIQGCELQECSSSSETALQAQGKSFLKIGAKCWSTPKMDSVATVSQQSLSQSVWWKSHRPERTNPTRISKSVRRARGEKGYSIEFPMLMLEAPEDCNSNFCNV